MLHIYDQLVGFTQIVEKSSPVDHLMRERSKGCSIRYVPRLILNGDTLPRVCQERMDGLNVSTEH